MAKVPNGVETSPKISMAWVGCTNVTDRQTDDRRTDDDIANMNLSSRSLKTCLFHKSFPSYDFFFTRLLNVWAVAAALQSYFFIKVLNQ